MTRLFHVSDLHFGREDEEALDWFAKAVRDEKPDAVIVTGDLTMRARSREFAAACEWLSGLGVPLSIEPGNHDLPYYNPIARFFRPYKRFGKLEGRVEKPLQLPGLLLAPLKTTARAQWRLNWADGIVNRDSLAGALDLIARRPEGAVAIVACHHPLVKRGGPSERGKTLRGAEAIEALAKAGVCAVLSGHVHDPFDLRWEEPAGAVRMIGAGTLSERVRSTPPSFNELTIGDGGLDVVSRAMP